MTKREAKRIAYAIAYRFVQSSIDVGGSEAGVDYETQQKIDNALDDIAQSLFERADPKWIPGKP